jgi:hypothetical protein
MNVNKTGDANKTRTLTRDSEADTPRANRRNPVHVQRPLAARGTPASRIQRELSLSSPSPPAAGRGDRQRTSRTRSALVSSGGIGTDPSGYL